MGHDDADEADQAADRDRAGGGERAGGDHDRAHHDGPQAERAGLSTPTASTSSCRPRGRPTTELRPVGQDRVTCRQVAADSEPESQCRRPGCRAGRALEQERLDGGRTCCRPRSRPASASRPRRRAPATSHRPSGATATRPRPANAATAGRRRAGCRRSTDDRQRRAEPGAGGDAEQVPDRRAGYGTRPGRRRPATASRAADQQAEHHPRQPGSGTAPPGRVGVEAATGAPRTAAPVEQRRAERSRPRSEVGRARRRSDQHRGEPGAGRPRRRTPRGPAAGTGDGPSACRAHRRCGQASSLPERSAWRSAAT